MSQTPTKRYSPLITYLYLCKEAVTHLAGNITLNIKALSHKDPVGFVLRAFFLSSDD